MLDQTVCPARLAGWAHDETGAELARNGRGFGNGCAHGLACQCGKRNAQGVWAGGKHVCIVVEN